MSSASIPISKCPECGAYHTIGKHIHSTGLDINEIEDLLTTDGEYENRYKGVRFVFD